MRWLYSHRKQLTIAFIIVITLVLIPKIRNLSVEDLIHYTPSSPFLAALALIGLYCLRSVIMAIPNILVCVAIGIIFPPVWGIIISIVGIFCETTISYYLGKKLGAEEVTKMLQKNKKANKFFTSNQDNTTTTCFIARITPLPIGLTSMFFGGTKMPWNKYIIASILGLSPKMIPYVLAGTSIENPLSARFLLPFVISFSITLVAFIIYQKVTKSKSDSDHES